MSIKGYVLYWTFIVFNKLVSWIGTMAEERKSFWWKRLTKMLMVYKEELLVNTSIDFKIEINPQDYGDVLAVFDDYDRYNVVWDRLNENDVVVDIGAHIGMFAIECARQVQPYGRVLAYEPSLTNIQKLRICAKRAHVPYVLEPLQKAVSASFGEVTLYCSTIDNMWTTLNTEWSDLLNGSREHIKTYKIPTVSLDDIVNEKAIDLIHLLKIDVEANELKVLKGAKQTLTDKKVRDIVIEIHDPVVPEQKVLDILQGYGYCIIEKSRHEYFFSKEPF